MDTHQTEHSGAVWVWEATVKAAQERLDTTLAALRKQGLTATGALGDAAPLVALKEATRAFGPDRLVIATHPDGRSAWLHEGEVSEALGSRELPERHIVSSGPHDAQEPVFVPNATAAPA